MNIKVAAFTVSEKSSNTYMYLSHMPTVANVAYTMFLDMPVHVQALDKLLPECNRHYNRSSEIKNW